MAGNFNTLRNIAKAAMDPAKAAVMINKVQRRLFDPKGDVSSAQHAAWLNEKAVPMDTFLSSRFDSALVSEAQALVARISEQSAKILSDIPHDLGGGGGIPLLYLVTRLRKPKVVVETGVAAGFSSASILAALAANGDGHLYSSDFPYFRIENPEQYIGVVVPQDVRDRWTLLVKGDAANVPQILSQIDHIDLLHYDSDKSYAGRQLVMGLAFVQMSDSGVVIMDDIQDNAYFHDFVKDHGFKDYSVISYDGKFIGYIQL
ncbi:MAG: class I SAM-dependent methyltransferase [Brevundimonas sp.]|nr:class I SAM-dependent methyltransferase [Brevundimonas sp.]